MTRSLHYDVLIVGGGMVGASLALALADQDLRLGIIEASLHEVDASPSYDDRAIALAYGSRRIFEALAVWPSIEPAAQAIEQIHVSNRGHFGFTRLKASDEQVAALGYVVTARDLGVALLGALRRQPRVETIAPATVTAVFPEGEAVRVLVKIGGSEVEHTAGLLVAADGAQSFIRDALGFRVRRWDYGESAVVANITPQIAPQGTAFERFTETGPVALLPMRGSRCALVWTVPNEEVGAVLAYDDRRFIQAFQQRFGSRLGRFERVGVRTSYRLSFLRTLNSVRPRIAVIGNAAHTLHPIAGQGFNLGIRDVAVLAEVIVEAQRHGQDFGAGEVLTRYDCWRRSDQQAVALATDGLARLFKQNWLPVRIARNLGMLALDGMPYAKHRLARAAMGTAGRLPRLARGLAL
jgi:2-octaprenyl-6-methoxyphenol hydroxylase